MKPHRPGVLTLVTIYLWVVAIASLLTGLIIFVASFADDAEVETGLTITELRTTGIIEMVIGVIVVITVLALARGSEGARLLVAAVAVIRIAATIFIMVWMHTQSYWIAGALHVLLPIFILWVLYGNDKVNEYFEATG